MKAKIDIYVTDPAAFLDGDAGVSLTIRPESYKDFDWYEGIHAGQYMLDIGITENEVRVAAVKRIDAEIEKRREDFTNGMQELKAKKAELLSLAHAPSNVEPFTSADQGDEKNGEK